MSILVSALDVTYPSGRRAVQGVSFQVRPGEVLALLGGNGAGKSTTMKAVAGVIPATAGQVLVSGHDLGTDAGADAARAVTGYCPDVGGLPRALSVRECIGLALACIGNLQAWPAAHALAQRLDLARVLDEPTGSFSHGMARRTSVLLALLGSRDVLLLDEPFDGVDAEGVAVLSAAIRAAADAGLAVVVSTHLMDVATAVADRCLVMAGGRVTGQAHPTELAGAAGADTYRALLRIDPAGATKDDPVNASTEPVVWTPGDLPEHLALGEPDLSGFESWEPWRPAGDPSLRELSTTKATVTASKENFFLAPHWTMRAGA